MEQNRELVKQYTTFEPYFSSRENLLDKSASDIKDVKSIVSPDMLINNNTNTLSWIKCKNNENDVFCLVEKRNFFGELLVYKIGERSILSSFPCHPSLININFKEKIFGPFKNVEFEIISKKIEPNIEVKIWEFIR